MFILRLGMIHGVIVIDDCLRTRNGAICAMGHFIPSHFILEVIQ